MRAQKIPLTSNGGQTKPTVATVATRRKLRDDARKKGRAMVDFFERSMDLGVTTKASNRFDSKQFGQRHLEYLTKQWTQQIISDKLLGMPTCSLTASNNFNTKFPYVISDACGTSWQFPCEL